MSSWVGKLEKWWLLEELGLKDKTFSNREASTTKLIEKASLAFQGMDNIHSGNSLPFSEPHQFPRLTKNHLRLQLSSLTYIKSLNQSEGSWPHWTSGHAFHPHRSLRNIMTRVKASTLLHWSTEQEGFIPCHDWPMWDKLAGCYLTASRSTNRLSEVPTFGLCCYWTCHQQGHTIAWDEALIIDSTPASTMCAGGMAPGVSPTLWNGSVPQRGNPHCTHRPWHRKCVLWQFPAKTLNGEWRGGTNQSNQSYTRDFYVHVNLRGYNSHLIGKHQR